MEESPKKLEGIDGWLLIYSLGVLLAPLILIGVILMLIADKSSLLLRIISIIISIGLLAFYIWFLILFFHKKKLFLKVNMVLLYIYVILNGIRFVYLFYYNVVQKSYLPDINSIIYVFMQSITLLAVSLVWLYYFRLSKRVKNTFVK